MEVKYLNNMGSRFYIKTLVALLQVFVLVGCNKDEITGLTSLQKDKALFVYMIADNDLDFYATANINEMEAFIAENPDKGSIYAYIDRAKNRKTAHPLLYQISADTTAQINSKILKVYPEKDSSNEVVFKEVLNEVITLTTTKNEKIRGLVLWSHGSAWLPKSSLLASNRATAVKSFGVDQTATEDTAINSEMDIRKLAKSLVNYHFDFLLFDACFMASIEVFYELKNSFDYIIASPTEVLATGFPYKDILIDMLENTVNYNNISKKYVSHFKQKQGILQSATVTTIKTSELKKFAYLFNKCLSQQTEKIDTTKWLQYDQEGSDYLFDIGDFLNHLQPNQTEIELSKQFEKLIVCYDRTSYFFNKIPLEKSTGVSIFVPNKIDNTNEVYDFYKTLSWNNAVNMVNYIHD
ncbi:hypothetical protein CKY20_00985 [Capnocytophaga canis]|uniref:Clostripain n=2 Tax=Capnocytophaga canis TaxID=1848903 RepID=A0A3A1YJ02_9FLAO|nr:hypothetical protein CKY20_00985 [Capnocytophaga canis]